MSAEQKDAAVVAGRGALFIAFAKAFFMISGFVQQWLLTKLLGAAGYGSFSVVNGMVSTVNNTVVTATIQSISKFTAEDEARAEAVKRAGLRMQAWLGTAVGAGFLLAAPWLSELVRSPHYTSWFRMVAAIPFLYAFYCVFVGSANGLHQFHKQARFDVTFQVLKTVLVLALAGVAGVTGAFGGFILAAGLILIIAARTMGVPRAATAGAAFPMSRLLGFMGWVTVYTVLINLALNYDVWLLKRFAAAAISEAKAADALVGHYQGVRNLALLPYQALIVITFVVFPMVSRSTFAADRDATRAYVSQTARYALILAGAMGTVLAARPSALLAILYSHDAAFGDGAGALPILVTGECALALLGVTATILNAAGLTVASVVFVAITVAVGGGAAFAMVPSAAPGAPMLTAMALATSLGMGAGFVAAAAYAKAKLGGGPPLGTVARVGAAVAAAVVAGRFMPRGGRMLGLVETAVVGLVFAGVLVASKEFGADDRAKLARILRRKRAG